MLFKIPKEKAKLIKYSKLYYKKTIQKLKKLPTKNPL